MTYNPELPQFIRSSKALYTFDDIKGTNSKVTDLDHNLNSYAEKFIVEIDESFYNKIKKEMRLSKDAMKDREELKSVFKCAESFLKLSSSKEDLEEK